MLNMPSLSSIWVCQSLCGCPFVVPNRDIMKPLLIVRAPFQRQRKGEGDPKGRFVQVYNNRGARQVHATWGFGFCQRLSLTFARISEWDPQLFRLFINDGFMEMDRQLEINLDYPVAFSEDNMYNKMSGGFDTHFLCLFTRTLFI